MKTVAEGVETFEQLELLRDLGCDAVQGYLISKPANATDLAHWFTGGTYTKLQQLLVGEPQERARTPRAPKNRHYRKG
jgi:predicted signal transduction protein with EAL and GGDEF domain